MRLTEEKYFVRVQLIRADKEGERITGSFDYEVSPTIEPYQASLFMRADKFYRKLQDSFRSSGGKVTITDKENLREKTGEKND